MKEMMTINPSVAKCTAENTRCFEASEWDGIREKELVKLEQNRPWEVYDYHNIFIRQILLFPSDSYTATLKF